MIDSGAVSDDADVLTWEAEGEPVDRFAVDGSEVAHVGVDGHAGELLLEDSPAVPVGLAEPRDLVPCAS